MNEHSCKANGSDKNSNTLALTPRDGQSLIQDRLFLQVHLLAHKRLKASYQRMQILLAAERQEPAAYPLIEQLHHCVSQLLSVFLDNAQTPPLSCALSPPPQVSPFVPHSMDFARRFRFEYVNHLFLRLRHRALKKIFCSIQSDALQAALAEADAANDHVLIAFEGYRKRLCRKSE